MFTDLYIIDILELSIDSFEPFDWFDLRFIFAYLVSQLLLDKSVDDRCGYYSFFEIIERRLTKLRLRLREVKDVVVNLESDAEMSTEVKERSMRLVVKLVQQRDASAAQWDHGCCFEISLRHIVAEVFLGVVQSD